jgi:hypothetical protein
MADEKEIIQEVRENLVEIKTTLKNMVETTDLKLKNVEDKLKVANNRIKDLEDNNKWLWRAIAGAIIGGVVALLLKK